MIEVNKFVPSDRSDVVDTAKALQRLLDKTASDEEIEQIRQLLISGEISIAGNVNQSVIIIGSGNTVDLTPEALDRLNARPLLGGLDRELTGSEIAFGLDRLVAELPRRAPVLIPQFQEQARRLRAFVNTSPAALSDYARKERIEALAVINTLCMETLDLSFNALCTGEEIPEYDSRSPFRGMESFRPEDREFFFGREELTQKLLSKINVYPFLAVLGASASGKSSLVMAGLIPLLDGEYMILRPGSEPLTALETAKDKALIVVDQFEELFTLTRDESTRKTFITRLLEATEQNKVIITLRADFLGEVGRYPALRENIQNHLEIIPPMSTDELRHAIERQAASVGLRFEADLSHQILEDVEGEPGAMPLLQHALWELWNRRHGRWLRSSEYRAFGGVRQAIARTAENVYGRCTPAEQKQIRDIFLRLTHLSDNNEGRDTRRRVPLSDLVSSGEERTSVAVLLDVLASARLIVKTANEEETKVEVAHEALISHWQRLQLWLNEDREGLYLHQHLSYSAHEWEDHGREAGDLYRGMRLQQAQQWMKDHSSLLSSLESDFLNASLTERKRERRVTLLRWSAFTGAIVLLLLTIRLAITGQINRFYYRPVDMQDYWIVIPAGEFQMGSESGAEDERPVHTIYLDAFEIGRHEVTNRQFTQCVRAGVCAEEDIQPEGRDLYPVFNVSWSDAATFCSWVGARLPTEAEWEKAARGGLEGKTYPWGDEAPMCTMGAINGANFAGTDNGADCPQGLLPVESFSANGYGLYDMVGNVAEWVNDWYSAMYYQSSPSSNPPGPEAGPFRVARGGAWSDGLSYFVPPGVGVLNVSYRGSNYHSFPIASIGFRCARDLDGSQSASPSALPSQGSEVPPPPPGIPPPSLP